MAPSKGNSKTKNHAKATVTKKPVKGNAGAKATENRQEHGDAKTLPFALQQLLLNIFRNSFSESTNSDISSTLQEIKGHLYNRDFQQAFGRKEYLEAYAVRWSPSRALCYAEIFKDILPLANRPETDEDEGTINVLCLGGGAGAEIVGLAGAVKAQFNSATTADSDSEDERGKGRHLKRLAIRTVDIADWSAITTSLASFVTTPPPLSQYASAIAKANNVALVPATHFTVSTCQSDLLSSNASEMQRSIATASLITLMFTLNELYTTSVARTQKFLVDLTATLRPGSLLLVVDSAGSYSTVTLNGKESQYEMHWLLDATLQQKETIDAEGSLAPAWAKLRTSESNWFRLPEGLKYPIPLENMRYQLHLYRKT